MQIAVSFIFIRISTCLAFLGLYKYNENFDGVVDIS